MGEVVRVRQGCCGRGGMLEKVGEVSIFSLELFQVFGGNSLNNACAREPWVISDRFLFCYYLSGNNEGGFSGSKLSYN